MREREREREKERERERELKAQFLKQIISKTAYMIIVNDMLVGHIHQCFRIVQNF